MGLLLWMVLYSEGMGRLGIIYELFTGCHAPVCLDPIGYTPPIRESNVIPVILL